MCCLHGGERTHRRLKALWLFSARNIIKTSILPPLAGGAIITKSLSCHHPCQPVTHRVCVRTYSWMIFFPMRPYSLAFMASALP